MERVVVGVDGSVTSLDALSWSADFARRAGLELVVARVFVAPQAELPPDFYAEAHADQRQELEQWCDSFTSDLRWRALLLDGDAPEALLACARDEQADLLVVGGRGTGGFTGLQLGSTAHHLAHHATLPLAIVPTSGAGPIQHVIAGVDGSVPSLAAAGFAADLAADLGVEATAVYALSPMPEWVKESDPRSWRSRARKAARSWAEPLEARGVTVDIDIERETHPVVALGHALEAHPGSVAIVGTRGLGGFTGLRLGHVPLQLVHHTGAATILVPPPPARPT